ncbi:MAG: hypothetical protein WB800_38245, partial [Streptosporangiaceae bacterium]
ARVLISSAPQAQNAQIWRASTLTSTEPLCAPIGGYVALGEDGLITERDVGLAEAPCANSRS